MTARERRQGGVDGVQLRRDLTSRQLSTLETMQQFGWVLQFVRRPMFMAPIPVVFDRARQRYAVIEEDGTINENPGFRIRE